MLILSPLSITRSWYVVVPKLFVWSFVLTTSLIFAVAFFIFSYFSLLSIAFIVSFSNIHLLQPPVLAPHPTNTDALECSLIVLAACQNSLVNVWPSIVVEFVTE